MTAFAPFSLSTLPAFALVALLWVSPAMAGDTGSAESDVAAPVVLMDEDGAAVSGSDAELVIMPDGTVETAQETPAEELEDMAEDAHAAEAKGGFPQLDTSTYSSQVFWLAVFFGLMYFMMSRIALPRVTEVLDMRQTQINTNLDRAAQLNDEAQRAKEAYDSALAEAQDAARASIAATEAKAAERMAQDSAQFGEHARTRMAEVEKNIAKAKADALNSLADIAADVAAEMVAKVGQVQIGKAEARQAVQAVMDKAA